MAQVNPSTVKVSCYSLYLIIIVCLFVCLFVCLCVSSCMCIYSADNAITCRSCVGHMICTCCHCM